MIDGETVNFLRTSGRRPERVALVEAYAKANMMWRPDLPEPLFSDTLSLDMSTVVPSMAGPKRPQDRVPLTSLAQEFCANLEKEFAVKADNRDASVAVKGRGFALTHGAVVIAAITSCTNTSNPSVMLGAGLLARNARRRGLTVKPWVKTSLAPGSQVVTDYLTKIRFD